MVKIYNIVCYNKNDEPITNFTQWDINQILKIKDWESSTAPIFHFCNKNSEKSIGVQSKIQDKEVTVDVPNILLQEALILKVFVYLDEDNSGRTVYLLRIPVNPKPKPLDYEYTDNIDVVYIKDIIEEIKSIEEQLQIETQEAHKTLDIINEKLAGNSDSLKIYTVSSEEEIENLFTQIEANPSEYSPGFIITTIDLWDNWSIYAGGGYILIDIDGTFDNMLLLPYSCDDGLAMLFKEPLITKYENYSLQNGVYSYLIAEKCKKCRAVLEFPRSDEESTTITISLGESTINTDSRNIQIPLNAKYTTQLILNINLEWRTAQYDWAVYLGTGEFVEQGSAIVVRDKQKKETVYLWNSLNGVKIIISEYREGNYYEQSYD